MRGGITNRFASMNRRQAAGILALVLLALLAVVVVASSGSRGDRGSAADPAPTNAFWDYLATLILVAILLSLGLFVWGAVANRGAKLRARKDQNLRAFLIFGLTLLALFLLVRSNRIHLPSASRSGSAAPAPTQTGSSAATTPTTAPAPYEGRFRWELLVALGGLGALTAAAFAVYNRRRREPLGPRDQLAEELSTLLDDTLADLLAEPDPRRAVIAAYARMERVLAFHGLPRRAFEAPLEYLDRIAPALPVASASRLVFELTHLYERARFSLHEIDEAMKAEAIATLASLRDELMEEAEAA